MNTMADGAREQFEAWTRKNYPNIDISRGPLGDYVLARVRNDWQLWQAALAARQPVGFVLVPVEPTEEMLDLVPESTHPILRKEVKRLAKDDWRKMIAARPKVP